MEAANWAPTHGRTEPWKFVVLGRAQQEKLLDLTLEVHITSSCLNHALAHAQKTAGAQQAINARVLAHYDGVYRRQGHVLIFPLVFRDRKVVSHQTTL